MSNFSGPENKYVVGDLVKLTARFQDPVTGQFVQPDHVTCEVLDPDGQTTQPTPTYNANLETPDHVVGKGYFAEVDAEKPGPWYYRFSATGTGQAAEEGSFYVERSAFA